MQYFNNIEILNFIDAAIKNAGAFMSSVLFQPLTMGVGYADTPGIWSHEQITGWKKVKRPSTIKAEESFYNCGMLAEFLIRIF